MSVFRCGRFPHGVAHVRTVAGIVEFRDGKAYVDDPVVAEALREVPEAFRVTEEVTPEDPALAALRAELAAARARIAEFEAERDKSKAAEAKPRPAPKKAAKPVE